MVANNGNYVDYHKTGIIPKAGETLDIVVHAIWGRSSNGLLQVWINGDKVYDKQVATIYKDTPWGGNAKWGIYYAAWKKGQENVQWSLDQGIKDIETFMGPLRIITQHPDDDDYKKDLYDLVKPR